MPLPAEKGLKPKKSTSFGGVISTDLMPLPAEKGLKHDSEYRKEISQLKIWCPFQQKKDWNSLSSASCSRCFLIWCPFQQKKDWNTEQAHRKVFVPLRFDAPSSRKRIETRPGGCLPETHAGFDAPSSRKRIETTTSLPFLLQYLRFDAPSSRKRIETIHHSPTNS